MFESGIQRYATFQAVIETGFPVDNNGVAIYRLQILQVLHGDKQQMQNNRGNGRFS